MEAYGVAKIYTPEDGARMGLQGIVNHMVRELDYSRAASGEFDFTELMPQNKLQVANLITTIEQAKTQKNGHLAKLRAGLKQKIAGRRVPLLAVGLYHLAASPA